MSRAARACALLLLVAAAAAFLPAPAASAEAAATVVCWKRLINDWYDGRIDQAYPVRCYREAIAHLPEDVEVYSSAREDIRRALLAAIRAGQSKTTTKITEATPVKPPPKKPESKAETETNAPATGNSKGDEKAEGGVTRDPDDEEPIDQVLAVGEPNSSDSVPLPLIVLAGLAMLLLAAAGAGLVTRRLQARKAPGPHEPPPAE